MVRNRPPKQLSKTLKEEAKLRKLAGKPDAPTRKAPPPRDPIPKRRLSVVQEIEKLNPEAKETLRRSIAYRNLYAALACPRCLPAPLPAAVSASGNDRCIIVRGGSGTMSFAVPPSTTVVVVLDPYNVKSPLVALGSDQADRVGPTTVHAFDEGALMRDQFAQSPTALVDNLIPNAAAKPERFGYWRDGSHPAAGFLDADSYNAAGYLPVNSVQHFGQLAQVLGGQFEVSACADYQAIGTVSVVSVGALSATMGPSQPTVRFPPVEAVAGDVTSGARNELGDATGLPSMSFRGTSLTYEGYASTHGVTHRLVGGGAASAVGTRLVLPSYPHWWTIGSVDPTLATTVTNGANNAVRRCIPANFMRHMLWGYVVIKNSGTTGTILVDASCVASFAVRLQRDSPSANFSALADQMYSMGERVIENRQVAGLDHPGHTTIGDRVQTAVEKLAEKIGLGGKVDHTAGQSNEVLLKGEVSTIAKAGAAGYEAASLVSMGPAAWAASKAEAVGALASRAASIGEGVMSLGSRLVAGLSEAAAFAV